MKIAACIGSRSASMDQLALCAAIGVWLAEKGWVVRTGNARGADQAYAAGASSVDPSKVHLCLPWTGYEREAVLPGNVLIPYDDAWEEEAAVFHPVWCRCSSGVRKLHARNVGVICGTPVYPPANVVIALRRPDRKGGTEHALRVAEAHGIPIIDITDWSSLL